jgi:uncharacterized peroxidase-related enzyme
MPRIAPPDTDDSGLLAEVEKQLGRVPNLYATMAASPAALDGYLAMRDKLSHGTLRLRVREQLALLVAQQNGCTYCVSAHSLRASKLGLSDDDLVRTRAADSEDPHTRAVLRTARAVMRTRGRVSDDELADARAAGVTDAELGEIVAHVALNTPSNYFNHLAQPELDFPEVPA